MMNNAAQFGEADPRFGADRRRLRATEKRTKPLLDEANAIVRILGKGVSTTRRRMAESSVEANPVDKDAQ